MKRLCAAMFACLSLGACADDAAWYLQLDNDVVFGTDRWYTSGVRLARVARHESHAIELGLLQEIYTPEAKRFTFGTVDRPPAARSGDPRNSPGRDPQMAPLP